MPTLPKRYYLIAVAAAALAAAAYASTAMLIISGSDSEFTLDTGEFQVALAEWGTAHHTGYPLYMLLGSPFVSFLRVLDVPPSAGASIFSLVWAALAVGGATLIALRLTGQPWLAFGCGLAFGLTRSMWIHASIAEVYSMSIAITVTIVWVTVNLLDADSWNARQGWLLALLAGVGVAHHRLIAVALPVIGLMLWPPFVRRTGWQPVLRWLIIAALCFALGFLPYLDMPLRVWRGATWVYGQPAMWSGFWYVFFGTEVKDWQKPVFEFGTILINLRDIVRIVAEEMTWPGLIASSAGAAAAIWDQQTRRAGILLGGIALSYVAFSALTRKAVLLEANLMPVILCLMLGLALGLNTVRHLLPARLSLFALRSSLIGLLLLSAALFALHRPAVLALTRDPAGVKYIAQFEKLDAPPGSVVMAPWGWRYFALSYAQRFEGKMKQWNIVDHRADFAALTRDTGRVYTAADTFYIFTADQFWAPRIGGAHLSSAGPGLVQIARAPTQRDPSTSIIELGDGLALVDVRVPPPDANGNVDVIVRWTATAKPSRDYSTFVHVSDAEATSSPEDLIAQNDQIAPVYAWYATSKWSPGELVREDHSLILPLARPAKLIVVGMYTRDEAGNFVNLGKVEFVLRDGKWIANR